MHAREPGPLAPSPLIEVAELAGLLGEATLLDVRWRLGAPSGEDEFRRGHVPGAVYVDLERDLAGSPGDRGRHPLPEVADLETAMRAVGVHDHRPVVVYDDWAGRAAARCWWLLRWAGHRDVRLLDGGWSRWQQAGEQVETGPSRAVPGDFTARPAQMATVTAGALLDRPVVLDARNPERFTGEEEPVDPVAGHVPGAVNVPTGDNLRPDGTFKSPQELRETYAVVAGQEPAVYCGSGVTAAHGILALELAGIPAALYPGSWSEWVTDPTRPVVTGTG